MTGLPLDVTRALATHYRIDDTHSNAYTAWKRMGSPRQPSPEQRRQLEAAGQLELLESPKWIDVRAGTAAIDYTLPQQAVSLVSVSW